MRDVADQLQRAATEPPGHFRHGAGVRPGADPAGRGAAVPAAQQLETSHHQPEGDQPPASDVTGRRSLRCPAAAPVCAKEAAKVTRKIAKVI